MAQGWIKKPGHSALSSRNPARRDDWNLVCDKHLGQLSAYRTLKGRIHDRSTVPASNAKNSLLRRGRPYMTAEKLPTASLADLKRIARTSGGGIILTGSIAWNKGMLGWKGNWQLQSTDGPHDWQIQNVNFDAAFRSAMRGAAQVLSGRGESEDEMQ